MQHPNTDKLTKTLRKYFKSYGNQRRSSVLRTAFREVKLPYTLQQDTWTHKTFVKSESVRVSHFSFSFPTSVSSVSSGRPQMSEAGEGERAENPPLGLSHVVAPSAEQRV